jgi:hypothetical protein
VSGDRKRLEVEALGEARWGRIQRSLFERMGEELPPTSDVQRSPRGLLRSNVRRAVAIVATLAAAAAAGGLVVHALGRPAPLSLAPSHLETEDSASHVALGESAFDLGPRSEVLVTGDDERGVLLVLDHGRVDCEVAPRHGRPPFVVQAGDVRVRVVGTHFAVTRDGGVAHVEVMKGVVEVSARGEVSSVRAGERWPAAIAVAAASSLDVASVDAPSPDAPPLLLRPIANVAPLSLPATARPKTELPPAAPLAAPPSVPVVPAPQALYETAANVEASDPARALATYRELAHGSGPWAANALFAEARLEADRGARGSARRLLEEYLARFPHGANAHDARQMLDRPQAGPTP